MVKTSSMQKKCHRQLYYYINLLISEHIYHDLQSTLVCVNNKTVLFYPTEFFSRLLNQYISNISDIYNFYYTYLNLSLSSQMICEHMFSDPKSVHILNFLVTSKYTPNITITRSKVSTSPTSYYFIDPKLLGSQLLRVYRQINLGYI